MRKPTLIAAVLGVGLTLAAFAAETESQLVIHADQGRFKIDRNIYGHFSEHLGRCIYEGFWVGEKSKIPNTRGLRNDVVAALKKTRIPVLRWPGGCFADEYHWMDGIGPKGKRPSMVNTHWGKVTENNHFGTHEFFDLCALLECEPYICGNVGSGSVVEMQQWVEYITFDGQSPMADLRKKNGRKQPWGLKYFGVGNENWGCGGNMTPNFYADQYKRYATYVRDFGTNRIFKIACGPNGGDTNWTEAVMRDAGRRMDGLSVHFYCGTGRKSRSATQFDEGDWIYQLRNALRMENLVVAHGAIMDKYDPKKRVAMIVDEWGAWHAVEPGTNPGFLYQQNTIRDALVAGLTLNIFNQYCERVRMANIAQTVNVLQALVLTDGPKMLLTPTYHVFEMYAVHHDATMLPIEIKSATYSHAAEDIPAVSASASRDKAGKIHLTLCNTDPNNAAKVNCGVTGATVSGIGAGRVLTAAAITAHNTFEQPENVKPAAFSGARKTEGGFEAVLPPKSVVVLELQ
jgi:alpha-N-arabinofuranosidase